MTRSKRALAAVFASIVGGAVTFRYAGPAGATELRTLLKKVPGKTR